MLASLGHEKMNAMKTPRPRMYQKMRPIQDLSRSEHDTYRTVRKLAEGTSCPDCGATFAKGRWQWKTVLQDAPSERCPACLRIRDQFPAGYVNLAGAYVADHRAEVLSMVHNLELKEKAEHPLQRVMKIEENSSGMLITTTDVHLARAIGDTLHRAHGGKLEVKYNADENLIRVSWIQ
jgi:NMD protein affecting ribosome stability and mRNA decay